MRMEDLDPDRSRAEYSAAALEDLRWLGIDWQEGPDIGGPYAPYVQSQRHDVYLAAWKKLREGGFLYPCRCSRKDLAAALSAPHESEAQSRILSTTSLFTPAPAARLRQNLAQTSNARETAQKIPPE